MKKLIYLIIVMVVLGLIVAGCTNSVVPPAEQNVLDDKGGGGKPKCATIQDGTIFDTKGNAITMGYDKWGYNYQAHIFNGWYWNYSRPDVPWTKETLEEAGKSNTWLVMKWSDTWLSNKDCNGDGKLDKGYDCDHVNANSSACEGAWCTNHQSGSYPGEDGKICKWTYFVKIVKAPADAVDSEPGVKNSGVWYTADGTEIGPEIWGAYAKVQMVENDPCAGIHGAQYISPVGPGLGQF